MRRRRGQRVCVHVGPFFGPSASATREREQKTRSVLREGRATSTMTLERGLPGGGRGGESGASGGRLCTRGTNQPTDIRSYIRGNIELWKEI